MSAQNRDLLNRILMYSDVLSVLAAFILGASKVYQHIEHASFEAFLTMRVELQNVGIVLSLMIVWHLLFKAFGCYQYRVVFGDWSTVATEMLKPVSILTITVLLAGQAFNVAVVTATFLATFWIASLGLLVGTRLALRNVLQRLHLVERSRRHVIIVGTNARALALAKEMQAKSELGYRLVGFVDEDWTGSAELRNSGHRVVSDFANFGEYLKHNVVDDVLICVPVKSFYDRASRILAQCQEQGITVRYVLDVFPTIGTHYLENIGDSPVVTVAMGAMRGGTVWVKRAIDFTAALGIIIVLSPVLLATALAVKFSSPGPILFSQARIGVNKRRFQMFKFRTMVPDAEKRLAELEKMNEAEGPVFKIKHDPRITPVGAFLRKTSLDELPQLFNVLIGDMSLVGPRPLPVRDYEGFSEDWHRRRFSVRPGITCLWQIAGRSSIPFQQWMALDMQYIDEWSLWLDMKILLRTVPVVLRGSGAY